MKAKSLSAAAVAGAIVGMFGFLIPAKADPAPVIVKPSAMNGWAFFDDNGNGGMGQMVPGPTPSPLGTGSAELAVSSSNQGYALGTTAFSGTPLADVTNLGYSSYQPGPTLAIALQFDIRYRTSDTSYGGRLVYEPYQNGAVAVGSGWQDWNPLNGIWWASKTSAAGSNGACPQSSPCSWATILSDFPDATIHGAVLFKAGSGWTNFDGNVDAFTIGVSGNDTTFDFEPETPCTTVCYVNGTTGNDSFGGDSPSSAKRTIQAGVTQVSPGGSVIVAAGTYDESVVIDKALTLDGAQAGMPVGGRISGGPAEATVSGVSNGSGVFQVDASNVTIDGFTVENTRTAYSATGVDVKNTGNGSLITNDIIDGITTPDTTVNGTAQAIYLEAGPDNVTISDNLLTNVSSNRSAKGVLIGDGSSTNPSTDDVIAGNTITNVHSDTRGAYGVQINDGNGSTANTDLAVTDNTIDNLSSGGWIHAIGLEADTPDVTVTGNSIGNLTTTSSPDNVAVWFESEEASTSLPTAHVNLNNFNLPATAEGVAVQAPAGAVDGTCNWWNSSTGPTAADNPGGTGVGVTAGVAYTPWLMAPAPRGECSGGTARGYKTQALNELDSVGPTGNKDTDKRISAAITKVNASLDRPNWADDNHIDGRKAEQIFDLEKQAVKSLSDIKGASPDAVGRAITDLVTADQILAQTAINDARAAGGDSKKLTAADDEMAKARDELAKGHPDTAIDHYKNAWKLAQQAV